MRRSRYKEGEGLGEKKIKIVRGLTVRRGIKGLAQRQTLLRSFFISTCRNEKREKEIGGDRRRRRRSRSRGGGTIYLRTPAALCQCATIRRTTFLPTLFFERCFSRRQCNGHCHCHCTVDWIGSHKKTTAKISFSSSSSDLKSSLQTVMAMRRRGNKFDSADSSLLFFLD